MSPFQAMVERTTLEIAAKTGLEGSELKAATFDYMADSVEDMIREDPTLGSWPGVIHFHREMARQTRTGVMP